MRFASYPLGHMSVLGGKSMPHRSSKFLDSKKTSLSQYVVELDSTFNELWDKYRNWTKAILFMRSLASNRPESL
ncbi:hypothetical protein ACVI1I_006436 [Bradyrhizobium sp. USDA 4459]